MGVTYTWDSVLHKTNNDDYITQKACKTSSFDLRQSHFSVNVFAL